MYAPRPTTKVPTFRACSALDRTTRSSCLRATTGRDSGSQFNLSNVLDVRAARKVRSRVASRLKPARSRRREMHLARILGSADPIDTPEGQTCANRCTQEKWGIMRSANARDSGSRRCVLCACYATRMQ